MHLQVAEERWLASRCGNPLCTTAIHQPPRKQSLGKVKLSLAAGDLVVTQGPEPFCCVECEQYIRGYADLLGDPMQVSRFSIVISSSQWSTLAHVAHTFIHMFWADQGCRPAQLRTFQEKHVLVGQGLPCAIPCVFVPAALEA
jgi:hypothetical protein